MGQALRWDGIGGLKDEGQDRGGGESAVTTPVLLGLDGAGRPRSYRRESGANPRLFGIPVAGLSVQALQCVVPPFSSLFK